MFAGVADGEHVLLVWSELGSGGADKLTATVSSLQQQVGQQGRYGFWVINTIYKKFLPLRYPVLYE